MTDTERYHQAWQAEKALRELRERDLAEATLEIERLNTLADDYVSTLIAAREGLHAYHQGAGTDGLHEALESGVGELGEFDLDDDDGDDDEDDPS